MFCGLWSVLCFQQLMHLASLACICILIVKIISESLFHILQCHLTLENLEDMITLGLVFFCLNANQNDMETSQAFLQFALKQEKIKH